MREVALTSTGANGQTSPDTPSELNYGNGTPEGVFLGFATPIPSLYVDTSAPALWVKQTGNGTRTGWGQVSGGGGGGSQATSFTFDSPDILTGLVIVHLNVGDLLLAYALSISTAFNGTTPKLALGASGDPMMLINNQNATTTDSDNSDGDTVNPVTSSLSLSVLATSATDIVLVLSDGSSGDPGSTTGAGQVFYSILRS